MNEQIVVDLKLLKQNITRQKKKKLFPHMNEQIVVDLRQIDDGRNVGAEVLVADIHERLAQPEDVLQFGGGKHALLLCFDARAELVHGQQLWGDIYY